ncbi:hypothetical protein [Bacillus pseudomycoides]|uniref:hypothetical protein n=1 Tax=Bacillus pseudomycoides TaxID=64104 RepID=UPI001145A043|nr:hypothetical protein [Bacillus pseudomycoides]
MYLKMQFGLPIYIALIIGYAIGVSSDGGNIYNNLLDRQMCKMTEWDFRTQAIKLELKGEFLRFEDIKYLNTSSNKFTEF